MRAAQIHERLVEGPSLATNPSTSRQTTHTHMSTHEGPSPILPLVYTDSHQAAFARVLARIAKSAVEAGRAPSLGQNEALADPLTRASITDGRNRDAGRTSHPI